MKAFIRPLHVLIVVAALALLPWWLDSDYVFHIATMIAITIPMALGMNLMLKIGQLSLAMPGFMGIGAYASALLCIKLGFPPLLGLVAGALLAMVLALIVAPVFLRIKGVFFVLLTYAFSQIINLVFQEWTSLFGGNSGLYGIPKFSLFGWRLTEVTQYYVLALVFAALFYAAMRAIERSDIGAIFEALNENEMLSRATGSNALAWRIAAFAVSAMAAGVSGAIYAHYIGFLSPEAFGFRLSVDLIVINAVGGASSVLGPLLGSILVVPLPEVLRDARQYQLLIYGLCLMLFLIFMRKGLVAFIRQTPQGGRP